MADQIPDSAKTTRIYIRWSVDGQFIRKWSREPFTDGDPVDAIEPAAPPAMDREAVEKAAADAMIAWTNGEQTITGQCWVFEGGKRVASFDLVDEAYVDVKQRNARAATDAILSTLSADAIRQGEGWQPIETAPRDGTWFIADGGGLDRPTPMKWCERVGAWEADAVMLEDWDNQAEGYCRPLFWIAIPDRLAVTTQRADEVWRDIESAPKDGSEIDLWCQVRGSHPIRVTDCAWLHLSSGPDWHTRGEKGWEPLGAIGIKPTHWMPLPATPASHASDGGEA